jgi:signal recognition particle receptor subunit alpha
MIDLVTVFTRGGVVLWKKQLTPEASTESINFLVNNVLLEEKAGVRSATKDSYNLKWTLENDLNLVFVAMYLKISSLLYIEELLEAVKTAFCAAFADGVRSMSQSFDFDDKYDKVLRKFEARGNSTKRTNPRKFQDTARGQERKDLREGVESKRERKRREKAEAKAKELEELENNEAAMFESKLASKAKIQQLRAMKKAGGRKGSKGKRNTGAEDSSTTRKPKKGRVWGDAPGSAKDLDRSGPGGQSVDVERIREEFGSAPEVGDAYADQYEIAAAESSDDDTLTPAKDNSQSSGIFGFFSRLTGSKVLTRDDLEPVLEQLQNNLLAKNVAHGIAEQVCESVCVSLIDSKQPSFTRLKTTVKAALESSLSQILTPNEPFELLSSIRQVNAENRPYSIVFIGVNGVGKSTSLAKVAAYLMSKDMKVGITACDTFRSGAIEQLKTHALALDVPLYERGYDKDASSVAAHGIRRAQQEGRNVVLIDTAGRMQDNQPLMVALSKLINVNRPDLVLFVGEALVGNDAVDQLTKFNQSLLDLSTERSQNRMVDGIILTKFDTIDDKVGAAVSMTYSVGAPILFVGVGQTYRDLRKMNPTTLIRALLR